MSVTGELGAGIQAVSEDLIEAGMVQFVASDAHDLELRPPGLAAAYGRVGQRFGDEVAERLFVDHPRAVLEDRPLA
jgi:protein-tyrosine phosphatase